MELSKTTEGEWKSVPRTVTEKTAAKVKIAHDSCKTDFSFCNDKMTFDISGDPIDNSDFPSNVALKTEVKQAKGEWKAKLLFDIASPDFSGAKFYENVSPSSPIKQRYNYKSQFAEVVYTMLILLENLV